MGFDGFLREACPPLDLQWRKYRRRSVRHRVAARMRELGLEDFPSYLSFLEAHPEESAALADRMLVTVSRFFRDRQCWQRLADDVLRQEIAAEGGPYRVWSAGCCGGEEPYTLVMLWRSLIDSSPGGRALELTATDIDAASLTRARAARYEAGSLRELPESVRGRFFHGAEGAWRLDDSVIREVSLREANLMSDPPPREQDLVLCRYLAFTYYRGERRMAAARRLFSALREGGVLFIGRKEGLGQDERGLFAPVAAECGIYRKREGL
jgi:chemotaxis methyl-accepting protein methylase